MLYSHTTAKNYAITSFLLAVVEFLIVVIIFLELAANACQHPTIINNYNQGFVDIICHPFLELMIKPLYYAPVFTLWIVTVLPTTSLILAMFSFFRTTDNKWRILSASGMLIHFLILVGIIIEVKYEIIFLLS